MIGEWHNDWFDSQLIGDFFIIAVISFLLFMVVIFVKKDVSVLNFRMLKNIPFITGNIANMLLMGLLYGTIMVKIFYLRFSLCFYIADFEFAVYEKSQDRIKMSLKNTDMITLTSMPAKIRGVPGKTGNRILANVFFFV